MPDPRIWPIVGSKISHEWVPGISILVMAAHAFRADADFINDSDHLMYLARGEDAVVGDGPRLNPNGGSYHIGLFNLWLGDVYAICTDKQDVNRLSMIEGYQKPGGVA